MSWSGYEPSVVSEVMKCWLSKNFMVIYFIHVKNLLRAPYLATHFFARVVIGFFDLSL